jgi:probable rRNA maturation factor
MAIQYSSFQTTFKLSNPKKTSTWIERVVKKEGSSIESLSYVFCNDKYLLGINQEYLDHDTFTDIITFDLGGTSRSIDGEIYISIPRVRENARNLGVVFDTELHRVIIHGVLHLMGYKDKTKAEKGRMRSKEEEYLELR